MIELLLALSILSMVIGVGYTFAYYVNKSFQVASDQQALQFSVRMASERIEDIVRTATIPPEDENPSDDQIPYIDTTVLQTYTNQPAKEAIYQQDGMLMHYKEGVTTNILENYPVEDISFELTFKTNDRYLWINVKGITKEGKPFQINKNLWISNNEEKEYGDLGNAVIFKEK